jgi:hypothetical protein
MPKVYHRTYQEYREAWDKIRDCLRGQDRIHHQGQLYLPKPEGMTQDGYAAYLKRASFYGVAERTLRGMVGAITRNPPILTLPSRIESMRDVATFEGNSFGVLLEEVTAEVLSVGRIGLLLDYPKSGATVTSAPFISTFHAESILDWKEELVEGRQKLTMLRLHENNFDLADGVEQHLVLSLEPAYTIRRYHVTNRRGNAGAPDTTTEVQVEDDLVPTVNGAPLFDIPVAIVSPYNLKADTEKPPFLDLCNVNLAHYRNAADYEHSLYLTSQPTPWVAGAINEKNKPSQIGSGAFWVLPEGATCGILEVTGAGISSIKAAMDDKVSQMATLGARMVHDGKGRNETTDTAKLRTRSEMSLLFSSVNMIEAALLKLLRIAADWTSPNSANQVVLKLHRDFVTAQIDATLLTALIKAHQAGSISHDTLLTNLKRGEIVDPNRSLEEELALIEEEGGGLLPVPTGTAPLPTV